MGEWLHAQGLHARRSSIRPTPCCKHSPSPQPMSIGIIMTIIISQLAPLVLESCIVHVFGQASMSVLIHKK